MNDVLIVGAGPTGLMLAAELALAGIDAAVLEKRPTAELAGSRAGGFHSRTLELLDQRGIADRFLAEGDIAQAARFGSTALDLSAFPTRFPHSLGLWQNHIERILLGWALELGVTVRRGSRSPASPRTRPASTSPSPGKRHCEPATSSAPTAGAASSAVRRGSPSQARRRPAAISSPRWRSRRRSRPGSARTRPASTGST